MAIHFDKQEGDIWAGVIGYRAPDGSVIRTVKFYRAAEEPPAKATQLTEDEKEVSDGIVRTMVERFGQYVREAQALDKKGIPKAKNEPATPPTRSKTQKPSKEKKP